MISATRSAEHASSGNVDSNVRGVTRVYFFPDQVVTIETAMFGAHTPES